MKTLQEIVQDHKSLDQLMLENGGELTDAQQESIVDAWMLEIKSDMANKVDGYKYRQDSLESATENLKARAKMISQAAKVLVNMSDLLKTRLKYTMIEMTTDELVGNDFKYKLTSSKPSLNVTNEDAIDPKYFVETTLKVLDRAAVKSDLEHGVEIKGAELIESTTLRITANKKIKELK